MQLRHLRSISDMATVIGFTLPSTETKCFVTKVTVTWKRLHLWYKFEVLQLDEVKDRIKEAVICNIHCLEENSHGRYFPPDCLLRMTAGELQMFCTHFGAGTYEQLPSGQSIVLRSADAVYKGDLQILPNQNIYWHLFGCCISVAAAKKNRFLMHCNTVVVEGCVFKRFQRLEDRMRVDEAQRCLTDLLKGTAKAIEQLHALGIAHMDIRLENICFGIIDGKFAPVLIDLDRCQSANDEGEVLPTSCMYILPESAHSKTMASYDWLQLGWMVIWVLWGHSWTDDYHAMRWDDVDERVRKKPVIRALFNGTGLVEHILSVSPWTDDVRQFLVHDIILGRT